VVAKVHSASSVSPHREHGHRDLEPIAVTNGGVESALARSHGDLRAVLPHTCRIQEMVGSNRP
jgi:hypothetical protein